MSKTRASYRRSQHVKYAYTKPENEFAAILDRWGYKDKYLRNWDISTPAWLFHADFMFSFKKPILVIEIDGPVHLSNIQLKKSVWRDECLKKEGYVIIHVPVDMLLPVCKEVLEANVHQRIEKGEPLSLREALKLV